MEGLLIAVRAVHYGASIVLFGEIVFAALAAAHGLSAVQAAAAARSATARAGHRRSCRVIAVAWAVMVLSGALWLVISADQMSGRPLDEAMTASTLATVLGETVFGQAWSLRALLALALLAAWPSMSRGTRLRRPAWAFAVSVSGALLAAIAWSGHANAGIGVNGWLHHASDAAHLLAAGAWLGGLAPLAAALTRLGSEPASQEARRCAELAARFGNLAAVCVGVLACTGVVNSYYLLPTPLSLVEAPYGRLLLAKISLFAAMLAIASVNRMRLTPMLSTVDESSDGVTASLRLRRNVWTEQALGAGVVLIVAALGVTSPAMPTSM